MLSVTVSVNLLTLIVLQCISDKKNILFATLSPGATIVFFYSADFRAPETPPLGADDWSSHFYIGKYFHGMEARPICREKQNVNLQEQHGPVRQKGLCLANTSVSSGGSVSC